MEWHRRNDSNDMDPKEIGWVGGNRLDSLGSNYEPVTGTCEHSNEPSISTHKMPTI
jgi:hypothetical protein